MSEPEHVEDLPVGAVEALGARYGDADWTLLHAWTDEGTVLAVVAVAPAAAFDEAADAFDVDIVELHMLRVLDTLQGSWEVAADHEMALGTMFEDFAQAYLDRTEPPG